jgi:hypothetical protein
VTTKTRKKPVRRCFARVGWVEVGAGSWRFELTKAGLTVHERNKRHSTDKLLPFDRLTEGGGHEWTDEDGTVRFAATKDGLEVRRGGSRQARVIPYRQLANMANPQPLLFDGLEAKA